MRKYYYALGEVQKGPYTLEELANENITKDTLVWYDGLKDWVPAIVVGELASIIKNEPPALPKSPPSIPNASDEKKAKEPVVRKPVETKKNNNNTGLILLIIFLVLSAIGIFAYTRMNNRNSSGKGLNGADNLTEQVEQIVDEPEPLSEEQLKAQLYQKECQSATSYLSGSLQYTPVYKNILSMKVVGLKFEGHLTSTASQAMFSNMKIQVKFKAATGAVIFTKNFVVYEYILPGKGCPIEQEIEISNEQYQNIESFDFNIIGASCE